MILIDTREQQQDYIQSLFKSWSVPSEIMTLSHGMDYLITNNKGCIGIQRKVASTEVLNQFDYLRDDIIPALIELNECPVLLIEEDFAIGSNGCIFRREGNFLKETEVTALMYYNFCNSIRMMGCDVVCTRNLDQSIWWMIASHQYIAKHRYPKPKKRYGIDMQAIGMLCCINGIGITASTKLLKDFTIRELMHLPDADVRKLLTENQYYNFSKVFDTKVI